jgi:hypothetical protein
VKLFNAVGGLILNTSTETITKRNLAEADAFDDFMQHPDGWDQVNLVTYLTEDGGLARLEIFRRKGVDSNGG